MKELLDIILAPCRNVHKHHVNQRREQALMEARNYCYILDNKLVVDRIQPYTVSMDGATDYEAHVLSFADAIRMVNWYRAKFLEKFYPELVRERIYSDAATTD